MQTRPFAAAAGAGRPRAARGGARGLRQRSDRGRNERYESGIETIEKLAIDLDLLQLSLFKVCNNKWL